MKAWRRGLLRETYPAYKLRGEVARELVMYMMASEEDALQARLLADTALKAYSSHISNPDKLVPFAKRHADTIMYAVDRGAYKHVSLSPANKEKSLLEDKVVQAMIARFKYIKARGTIGEKESGPDN